MSTVPHSLEPVHFSPQTIYCGDCEEVLSQFPSGCADLIYIDPPFNSNRNYEVFWGDVQEKRAFEDRYGDAQAYIAYMRPRVEQLHRVLKPTGSFYYHCDWHASHYIKVMLDEIFGANYFQNDIAWKRTSAHNDPGKCGNVHDNIFFYTKSKEHIWNVQYQPYNQYYIDQFYTHIDDNGRRWRRSDLTGAGITKGPSGQPWRGIDVTSKGRHWAFNEDRLEELDRQGRIHWPKKEGGIPMYKRYLDEMPGVPLQSVWDDIPPLHNLAAERLGYPTQKPIALLERIINASSNPGDIVLDAFCGCGTTLVAARQLGRRFVGIDISPSSCNVMGQRLEQVCGMRQAPASMSTEEIAASWDAAGVKQGVQAGERAAYYRFSNLPRSAEVLRKLPGFEFENWAVLQLGEVLKHHGRRIRAQVNRAKVGDFGLDGKIYLVTNASIKRSEGKGKLFNEAEDYVPIQVKNTDKVGRPEIDKFAHALHRDERAVGFFIGWEFTKDAQTEIQRVARLDEPQVIIPVPVQQLIAETFDTELLALVGR